MIVFTFRLLVRMSDWCILEAHGNLLDTVPIIPLGQHNFLCYERSLLNGTKSNHITKARIRLFVTVGHAHATTHCDIETFQFTILVDNGNKAEVIGKDVDVVVRRNGDCNFELDGNLVCDHSNYQRKFTDLAREVELPIQWLKVLDSFTSHHLLVEPNFVIGSRSGQQMIADEFGKLIDMMVKSR